MLRNAGYRLVYQVKDRELIVVAAAAGKHERNEVYKAHGTAQHRLIPACLRRRAA